MTETMTDCILKHGTTIPDKTALHTPEGSLTYGELMERVKGAAAFLRNRHISPSMRIMVQAGASLTYVVNYLAVHEAGAVAVPVDKNAAMDTVLLMKKELSVDLFLAESPEFLSLEFACSGREAASCPPSSAEDGADTSGKSSAGKSPDEVSDILFTTGTTGKSKGVVLSHRAVLASVNNVWNGTGMRAEDVLLIPVPLNHSFGLRELRAALCIGATAVLVNGFAFARALRDTICTYGCTGMTCVPAAVRVLYRQTKGQISGLLGSLRYIEFCTAPLDVEMKQILLRELPHTTLLNSYGSTESAGAVYLNFSEHPDKLLSIGRPAAGVRIKVTDDDGKTIQNPTKEEPGRLAILGDMNMSGYWNAQELTREVLREGWMYTNDIAYVDEEGYIFLLGRADDVINVGGKKVAPADVENVAIGYPGIQECCCISAEDPKGILGNIPVLFVAGDALPDVQVLKDFLAGKLEAYKLPGEILEIAEIPKNYMGKTDRRALKEIYIQRKTPSAKADLRP